MRRYDGVILIETDSVTARKCEVMPNKFKWYVFCILIECLEKIWIGIELWVDVCSSNLRIQIIIIINWFGNGDAIQYKETKTVYIEQQYETGEEMEIMD